MSTKTNHQANTDNADRLLNAQERSFLIQIASGEPPFSQRAQALLAVDDGMTQSAAGHRAGLSIGQVRYWLKNFHKAGLTICPHELLDQTQQEDASSPPTPAEPELTPDAPDHEQVESIAEVQKEAPVVAETDAPLAPQADSPQTGKKPKKKAKKEKKKDKKGKKLKKKKKAKKGKKSKKEGVKGKSDKKKKKRKK